MELPLRAPAEVMRALSPHGGCYDCPSTAFTDRQENDQQTASLARAFWSLEPAVNELHHWATLAFEQANGEGVGSNEQRENMACWRITKLYEAADEFWKEYYRLVAVADPRLTKKRA
jgi:hypothetical protein